MLFIMVSFSELSVYYKAGKTCKFLGFCRGVPEDSILLVHGPVSMSISWDILTTDNENNEWLHNTGIEAGSYSR